MHRSMNSHRRPETKGRKRKKEKKGTVTQRGKDFSSQNQHTHKPTHQQPNSQHNARARYWSWRMGGRDLLSFVPPFSRTCLVFSRYCSVPSTLSPLCAQHLSMQACRPCTLAPRLCSVGEHRKEAQIGGGWGVGGCHMHILRGRLSYEGNTHRPWTSVGSCGRGVDKCGLSAKGKIGKYWRDHRSGRTVQIVLYFIFFVRGFPHAGKGGGGHDPHWNTPCDMLTCTRTVWLDYA